MRSMRPIRCSTRIGFHGMSIVDQHAAGLEVQTLRRGFRAEEDLDLRVLAEGRLDVFLAGAGPGFAVPPLAAPAAVAGHLGTIDLPELARAGSPSCRCTA